MHKHGWIDDFRRNNPHLLIESHGRITKVFIILYTNTAEELLNTFSEHKGTVFCEHLTKTQANYSKHITEETVMNRAIFLTVRNDDWMKILKEKEKSTYQH